MITPLFPFNAYPMFTGLIQDIGTLSRIVRGGDTRFEITTRLDTTSLDVGASIACSGCCLTIVEKGPQWFAVEASAETLSKTRLKDWHEGTPVNLEPSLRIGDELGGHLVFGHVDGLAELLAVEPVGDSHRLRLRPPQNHAHLVAAKGSVALDGISLTVNSVDEAGIFEVNIIPHTWQATTLQCMETGQSLNFEADMLARYVARMLHHRHDSKD